MDTCSVFLLHSCYRLQGGVSLCACGVLVGMKGALMVDLGSHPALLYLAQPPRLLGDELRLLVGAGGTGESSQGKKPQDSDFKWPLGPRSCYQGERSSSPPAAVQPLFPGQRTWIPFPHFPGTSGSFQQPLEVTTLTANTHSTFWFIHSPSPAVAPLPAQRALSTPLPHPHHAGPCAPCCFS